MTDDSNNKPQKGSLFQVDVDIDLSSNPKVREMFNDQKANGDMTAFFKAHDIHLASTYGKGGGNATHIELRGSQLGLIKFVNDFLSNDDPGGVYNLWYLRS